MGDSVHRGQVLVKLAAEMLNAEVDSRRAALRSAEAKAANANAALRRGNAVADSGLLSAADLDTLRSDQISAQAAVETAKSDLATSELHLRYTQVTSPDDGVITSRSVSVGQLAQAGTELLRLLRNNRIEWRAEVPEMQLSLLQPNQPVTITSVDGTVLKGTVRTVAPTIQITNRTALVYVDITSGYARPGMFARGEIETGSGNANLAPVASLVVQDGYSYLFVVGKDDQVERRRVKTGTIRGNDVEITEGASAGERVVVKGAGFLKDGDVVHINDNTGSGATAPPA